MKIHLSPPRNRKLYNHEAQTARKARYIITGLQLLSGATALVGIKIYFSDWLDPLPLPATIGILALIAFMLVAPAEMGIRETWSYLFRALLNRYNKGLDLFSVFLIGFIALFLTSYSFYLSQYATRNSMRKVAPKVELQDLGHLSERYEGEMSRIAKDYTTQRNDINQRYDELIAAETAHYNNLIQENDNQIDQYKRKQWSTGQRYTTRINSLENESLQLASQRSESIRKLKADQNTQLSALEDWRRTAEVEAKEEKNNNRSNIQDQNKALQAENQAFASMFSTLIARFAAWSVILVILFSGYLEIFYYKTGIERVVPFSNTDFQAPAMVELLVFPYVYLSRHLTNFVRKKYRNLPDLVPSPVEEALFREKNRMSEYDWENLTNSKPPVQEKKNREVSNQTDPSNEANNGDPNGPVKEPANTFATLFDFEGAPEPKEEPMEPSGPPPKPKPSHQDTFNVKDDEPQVEPARSTLRQSGHKPRPAKRRPNEERVSLDGLFSNEPDAQNEFPAEEIPQDDGPTIKHMDRRTGQVQYFSMADLDEKIESINRKLEEAIERFQDSNGAGARISIEEHQSALRYWEEKRAELSAKSMQF